MGMKKVNIFKWHVRGLKLFGVSVLGDGPAHLLRFLVYPSYLVFSIVISLIGLRFPAPFPQKCLSLLVNASASCICFKIIVFYFKRSDLIVLISSLNDLESTNSIAKYTNFASKFHVWCSAIAATGLAILPIVLQTYELPYFMWLPVDFSTTFGISMKFLVFWLFLLVALSAVLIEDTLILSIGSQLCTKLLNLCEDLSSLQDDNMSEDQLKVFIVEHIQILKLIKNFEALLKSIFFVQTFASMVMSCTCALVVTKMTLTPAEIIKMIPIMGFVYEELLMYCWVGENLTTLCDLVHFSMYSSNWYNNLTPFRQLMLISQANTVKPKILKGASVVKMGLRTFLVSVQESYSWFMVFRSFGST